MLSERRREQLRRAQAKYRARRKAEAEEAPRRHAIEVNKLRKMLAQARAEAEQMQADINRMQADINRLEATLTIERIRRRNRLDTI